MNYFQHLFLTLFNSQIILWGFWEVSKLYRLWKGVGYMLWAYVLENCKEEKRDNQPLFSLIEQMEIEDNNIFFDMDGKERTELVELFNLIQPEDRLVVRSVEDMADSMEDLIKIFIMLKNKKITLCSCIEPFLSGEDFYNNLKAYLELHKHLLEKKKQIAYQKAVAEGRVGRPPKEKDIQKAIELYKSGNLTVEQITAISGISKTTLYRYINKQGGIDYGI